MDNQLLHQLIDLVNEFEKTQSAGENQLASFAVWLNDRECRNPRSYENNRSLNDAISQQPSDIQISILLGRMAKYARSYSKKILHDNNLSGLDDYSFLATLMFRPSMTKADLTHHNLTETTSGADIIKRLIKCGFIEEFECPSDKRARLVSITPLGKQTMTNVFKAMDPIAKIIPGNLSSDEKLFLLDYLKRLDEFHLGIYKNHRNSNIDDIKQVYIDSQK